MTVEQITQLPGVELVAGSGGLSNEVEGCFIGDLLSLAMSNIEKSNVWITVQTNINVMAVAHLCEASCVVICDGQKPDNATINRANMEDIPILITDKSAYALSLELGKIGV